jgi:lipase ATG15
MYPDADIWLVGHSLGGALASLLGSTFGLPAVAFESPGERLAANRLYLPVPPTSPPVTHVYHNADPIAMGTCNGGMSLCEQAGFALETKCHLGEQFALGCMTRSDLSSSSGKSIVYDTIEQLGWLPQVRKHVIREVVKMLDDDREWEDGRQVPIAREEVDCAVGAIWQSWANRLSKYFLQDCTQWKFGDFKSKD